MKNAGRLPLGSRGLAWPPSRSISPGAGAPNHHPLFQGEVLPSWAICGPAGRGLAFDKSDRKSLSLTSPSLLSRGSLSRDGARVGQPPTLRPKKRCSLKQ